MNAEKWASISPVTRERKKALQNAWFKKKYQSMSPEDRAEKRRRLNEWRKNNPEKRAAQENRHRASNPSYEKGKNLRKYKKHGARIRERNRSYAQRNNEAIRTKKRGKWNSADIVTRNKRSAASHINYSGRVHCLHLLATIGALAKLTHPTP